MSQTDFIIISQAKSQMFNIEWNLIKEAKYRYSASVNQGIYMISKLAMPLFEIF